jgi:hypothetical protein
LRSGLLGEFDLAGTVTINPTEHDSEIDVEVTRLHEQAHRQLASTTTFGVLQRHLACLVVFDKSEQLMPAGEAERLLSDAIGLSIDVHEAWALYCERRGAALHYLPRLGTQSVYIGASRSLEDLRATFSAGLGPLEYYVVRSCFEATMNMPIVSWGDRLLSPEGIGEFLGRQDLQPDHRLQLLTDALRSGGMSPKLVEELHAVAEATIDDCDLVDVDVPSALLQSWRNPTSPWEAFRRKFDDRATTVLDEEIVQHLHGVPTLRSADARMEIVDFWDRGVEMAAKFGVNLPRLVVVTDSTASWPLVSMQHDVVFAPPPWFKGIGLQFGGAPLEDVATTLRESPLLFVVWLDPRAVRLIPLEPGGTHESDPPDVRAYGARATGPDVLRLRPTNERLAIEMPLKEQLAFVTNLGEAAVATVVVARSVEVESFSATLTLAAAFSLPDRLGICLVPDTRHSTAVRVLEAVRGVATERLHRVFQGPRDEWMATVISDHVALLFRVPMGVEGMLRAYDAAAHTWLRKTMTDQSDPRLSHASMVAVLDRLGAFSVPTEGEES